MELVERQGKVVSQHTPLIMKYTRIQSTSIEKPAKCLRNPTIITITTLYHAVATARWYLLVGDAVFLPCSIPSDFPNRQHPQSALQCNEPLH